MNILNCKFAPVTTLQTINWAKRHLGSGRRGYVSSVDVSKLMAMKSNGWLKSFVDRSSLTIVDSQAIVLLSRLLRSPLPESVAGIDLVPGLCRAATDTGHSVFFLGSERETVIEVARQMKARFPDLEIAGVQHSAFEEKDEKHVASWIKESGAGLLISAMEFPREEVFLEEHWEEIGVKLVVSAGDAFDLIGGAVTEPKPRLRKSDFQFFGYAMFELLLGAPWRDFVTKTNTLSELKNQPDSSRSSRKQHSAEFLNCARRLLTRR